MLTMLFWNNIHHSVAHRKKSEKPNKLKVVGNKHTKRPKQENQNWLWLDISQVESFQF